MAAIAIGIVLIVAGILILALLFEKSRAELRAPCPFCAHKILQAAIGCKNCQRILPDDWSTTSGLGAVNLAQSVSEPAQTNREIPEVISSQSLADSNGEIAGGYPVNATKRGLIIVLGLTATIAVIAMAYPIYNSREPLRVAATPDPSVIAEQKFSKGLNAARAENYLAAYEEWIILAEKGHIESQFNIGALYESGLGVPKSMTTAATWYAHATAQGHASAQFNLGIMYLEGRGVLRDEAHAADLLRKAADQEHGKAQYNLAVLYQFGRGVPRDPQLAHSWFERARKNGVEKQLEQSISPERVNARSESKIMDADVVRPDNRYDQVLVSEVQRLLNMLGHDAGSPDGLMGPKTRAAIKKFQQDQGMKADGNASAAVLQRLKQTMASQRGR
jgi:hypothetical protein